MDKSKNKVFIMNRKSKEDNYTPVHKPIERYHVPEQYRFCSYCGSKMIKKNIGIACKNCGRIMNILID